MRLRSSLYWVYTLLAVIVELFIVTRFMGWTNPISFRVKLELSLALTAGYHIILGTYIVDMIYRRLSRGEFFSDFRFTPHKKISDKLYEREREAVRVTIAADVRRLEDSYHDRDELLKDCPPIADKDIKVWRDKLDIVNHRIKHLKKKIWRLVRVAEWHGFRFYLKKRTYLALKNAVLVD